MKKNRTPEQRSGESPNLFSMGDLDIILVAAAALWPLSPSAKLVAAESVLYPKFNNASKRNGGKSSLGQVPKCND